MSPKSLATAEATKPQLLESLRTFDDSHRQTPEWRGWDDNPSYKYALLHNGLLYPVKKVISLATGIPVSDFSGGAQAANKFVESRGFRVISIRAHSWSIESGVSAAKVLDKSAFRYNGTGVPQEIKWFFWRDQEPENGQPVTLIYGRESYAATLEITEHGSERIRLFWDTDFAALLQKTFPQHSQLYLEGQEPDSKIILRFQLCDNNRYEISFACEVTERRIEDDISAEEIEDGTARLEGKIREYFGKRYERDRTNRLKAIRHHGLSCYTCGFNFEEIYGERGRGFIEVHHRKAINTFQEEQLVDPKTDLITVCANCHRMLHRQPNDVLDVEWLKELIEKRRR